MQVEEFWQFYNHVRKPDAIEANSNYHLFKKATSSPLFLYSHTLFLSAQLI